MWLIYLFRMRLSFIELLCVLLIVALVSANTDSFTEDDYHKEHHERHERQNQEDFEDLEGRESMNFVRGYRAKRATCWGSNGGDVCRRKCQNIISSCTNRYYRTGHCEGWKNICVCKPLCEY